MIGANNYVVNTTPSIAINGEVLNENDLHNNPTLSMQSNEDNNNIPRVDSGEFFSHNDELNGNCMCLSNDAIDLYAVPITALRVKSRGLLSKRLNTIKVILSENGTPRDWRGVLNFIGSSDDVNTVQQKSDRMKEVLDIWVTENKSTATVGHLQQALGIIDRWDVIDDTADCFGNYFVENTFICKMICLKIA